MALQIFKIASTTVGSAGASSIDFTSIPSGYTDLKVVISTRSAGSTSNWLNLSFNGSTANFTFRHILNNFGSVISQNSTTGRAGVNNNTSMTANTFSSSEIYIPNYTSANNKIFSLDATGEDNGTTTVMQTIYAGLWSVTSAINQITITPDVSTLAQYSTATLYGIK